MKLDPRTPEYVQPIVKEHLRLTEQRLAGLISASYFAGSIALGQHSSYRLRFESMIETVCLTNLVMNGCHGYLIA